ncbi:unnamed protein product [Mytilus edulis]|uniref:C-type lectin domain-containing protein n=1 Tax=Mytilus edulis TaxID=6550 RepID=A0A8S3TRX9_MYTED|nr:unnamed protein product [Mytilus edulis]
MTATSGLVHIDIRKDIVGDGLMDQASTVNIGWKHSILRDMYETKAIIAEFTFMPLVVGEPNDAGNEDCVIASDRGWNDEHCNDRFRFVCQWPICGSRTPRNGACNEEADYNDLIIYRHRSSRNSGGGTCTSPGKCESCADGFFANGGYCTICPKIDHCNDRRCSGYYDNHCVYCEGSIKPKEHWEAYTLSSDNRKCNKACSWRSDSTRCYPGLCDEKLASKCRCTRGFSGIQCDEITESINIMHAEAKLSDLSNTILTTPDDPNVPYNQPVKWSNNNQWKFLELDFTLKYHTFERPPKPDPTGEKHFVTYFKYEIVKALLVIEHKRKGVSRNNRMLNCRNGYPYPIFHINNCGKRKKFDIQSWGFQHADKLTITCTAENGGFLIYRDREDGNRDIKVRLKGKTVQSSLIFRWDYITPYQECINGSKTDCNQPPVDCKDVSKQPDIKVRWGGWKDDLSGIDHFELELYELVSTGRHLNHINGPAVHRDEKISVHTSEQILKLPKPGMYSMILTSIDKAGNHQSARCFVFYDDISVVDIKHTKRIKVNEASAKTNYTWVSVDDVELSVTWTDRFLNERHENHGWLYGVAAYVSVQEEYDDLFGPRNVFPIENIHGIVKFEIRYEVYGPYLKANQSLTQTANELNQTEYLNITWEDGFRLDITIRAFDILNEYKDDMLSVYKDVSSPKVNDCIKKYDSTPRGSSCYCTMFHGCYHKHFQIRPDIVKDSGITPWKEIGLHDSDFYIEVTATNKALLKTKNTIQVGP